jgi:hypothetical protein
MADITLQQAQSVLDAALKRAAETGTLMDIAVVDTGGNLKAFARMDGAWLGSIDIALKKARTARLFDMDTGAIGALSQPGGPLYNIEVSNGQQHRGGHRGDRGERQHRRERPRGRRGRRTCHLTPQAPSDPARPTPAGRDADGSRRSPSCA